MEAIGPNQAISQSFLDNNVQECIHCIASEALYTFENVRNVENDINCVILVNTIKEHM